MKVCRYVFLCISGFSHAVNVEVVNETNRIATVGYHTEHGTYESYVMPHSRTAMTGLLSGLRYRIWHTTQLHTMPSGKIVCSDEHDCGQAVSSHSSCMSLGEKNLELAVNEHLDCPDRNQTISAYISLHRLQPTQYDTSNVCVALHEIHNKGQPAHKYRHTISKSCLFDSDFEDTDNHEV